ncbi:MAG: HAMP domain-containing protein [Clostridia bacterium]|nr:HAMP domain-containing protein [Clostridia bacterium]
MLKSIKFKTWGYMIGVVSVILIIMWLLGVVFLQDFYEYTKELDVKKVQVDIVKTLSKGDITENYEKLLEISRENDLFVEIFDNEGKIIVSPYMYFMQNDSRIRMSFGNMMSSIVATNAVKEMIETGENSKVLKIKPKEEQQKEQDNAIMLINKFKAGDVNYYVATRSSLVPIQSTADILGRLFVVIMLVVLVVSLVLAFAFASTITKPIRKLSVAARQVAAGNYDVNLQVENADELGVLTNDFNEMTKELGKVDSIRKDLIANVSHELRTPLTMIKGYAETIRDLSGDIPEKREKQLGIIIDETDRLSGLITNMLDLSRLQADKLDFAFEEFNLTKMLKKLMERYDIYTQQGFVFNMNLAEDVMVTGDYARLEQVVCNLVDNAINHSIDTQTVDIVLTENGVFNVRNFGDVIEPEDIRHIWDRYYKIDKSGRRRIAGTGIGLSIVKEILTRHNFKYGVTSDKINGTNFWIDFKTA